MRSVRSAVLFALAALIFGGGCHQDVRNRLVIDGPAATAGLPLALDIENRSGPVIIELDTSLQAPQVFARSMDARKQAWSAASYAEQDGRGVLRVLSAPNEAEPAMTGSSMLMIRTPTVDAVRIRSAGGAVELRGVAPTSIEIESGAFGGPGSNVLVNTFGEIKGVVGITTTAGDITYKVGFGSAGKLDASSGDGGIVTLRVRNASLMSSMSTQTKVTGVLNKGENDVKLATQNGSVSIEVRGESEKPPPR